jgi:hypothetical protein
MMQVLIALDQLINTAVWARLEGFGFADETLSARMYRLRHSPRWGAAMATVDAVFAVLGQSGHCCMSWLSERDRDQLPMDYSDSGGAGDFGLNASQPAPLEANSGRFSAHSGG